MARYEAPGVRDTALDRGGAHALSSFHVERNALLEQLITARESVFIPFKKRIVKAVSVCLAELIMLVVLVGFCAVYLLFDLSVSEWQEAASGDMKPLSKSIGNLSHFLIGFLLVPVPRTNVVFALLGCSFERAIRYHRWLANYLYVVLVVHIVTMVVYWITTKSKGTSDGFIGVLKHELLKLDNIYGMISFACITVMFLSSFEYVRRRFFEIFYKAHVLLFIPFLVFGALHEKWQHMMVAIAAPCALYGFDVLLRLSMNFFFGRSQIVALKTLSDKYVVITFKTKLRILPGQFVFLHIPRIAWLQQHPYSVSSVQALHDGQWQYTVHCKVEGSWSRRLLTAVGTTIVPTQMMMRVEGPYGQWSTPPLSEYPSVMVVGGGVGITPLLPTLLSVLGGTNHHSALERVKVVWTLRDLELMREFEQSLCLALDDERVSVHVYVTGKAGSRDDSMVRIQALDEEYGALDERINLSLMRPDLNYELQTMVEECEKLGCTSLAVAVCGPSSLIGDTERACAAETCSSRVSIECHSETFEL